MKYRADTKIETIIKNHLSARMERRPYRRVSVLERGEGQEARVDLRIASGQEAHPDDAGLAMFECGVVVTPARECPRESMDVVMEVIDLLHRAQLSEGAQARGGPVIIDIMFRKALAVGDAGATLAGADLIGAGQGQGVQLSFDVLVEMEDALFMAEGAVRQAS